MPTTNACWGIEVGAHAIKALKLEATGEGGVRVEAREVVGGRPRVPVVGQRARGEEERQHAREVRREFGTEVELPTRSGRRAHGPAA